jgi:hypothetical protein
MTGSVFRGVMQKVGGIKVSRTGVGERCGKGRTFRKIDGGV